MNELELELRKERLAEILENLELVDAARTLATNYGEGGPEHREKDSAVAQYLFRREGLQIYLRRHYFGDELIETEDEGELVLRVKDLINSPEDTSNPIADVQVTGRGGADQVEVLTYQRGRWENKLREMYKKLRTEASEEDIRRAKSKFSITKVEI